MRIVCLTSNAYHNCLPPFAYYWNKYYGSYDRPVLVAGYDAPFPNLPDNFEKLRIGAQMEYSWTGGLLNLLYMLDEEFILLMLEDYFIDTNVPHWKVDELHHYIKAHENVVKIDLTDDRMKVDHTEIGEAVHGIKMVESASTAPYQTSLQAAIWRTSFLRRFLSGDEDAWQFEKRGTKRVIAARQAGTFNGIILGVMHPILHYVNAVGGAGNFPGKITHKHMPDSMWNELVAKGWATNG